MYSSYSMIVVELEAGLCTLTLNRPDVRNAINRAMLDEMNDFLAKAKDDPNIRAVMITGAGDKAFSAGADVKEWNSFIKKRTEAGGNFVEKGGDWSERAQAMVLAMKELPKPVIAAVNGVALGGGCDMALVADIRFGSSNARFGEAHVKMGYSPDVGGTYLLPRLVGWGKAAELLFTGDMVDAEEAYRIGILNRLTTPENLVAEAKEFARRLAEGPTVAISQSKLLLNKSSDPGFAAQLKWEMAAGKVCKATEDNKEAVRAFTEKRKPVYKGR